MITKSHIYYYEGLFLDEDMMKVLNIQRNTGFELIFKVMSFNSTYILNNGEVKNVDKSDLMQVLGKGKNKDSEHFYYVVDNKFVLLPIKKYYGITCDDGKLFSYYDDETICNAKFSLVLKEGIQVIADDMIGIRDEIIEFNHQKELKRIYKSLNPTLK